jgi:NAD(P)-dependent dehydrogenase (short-subunit alcohol dehydrogenase family)
MSDRVSSPVVVEKKAASWPQDRLVLIAGASGGLGQACARLFSKAGARIVLSGRSKEKLDDIARSCHENSGNWPDVVQADLTDFGEVDAIFQGLCPEVVVHAVGANQPEPLINVTEETFDRLMAQNVRSAFIVCQAAALGMASGGSIVMITSQMGHVGAANRTVYCTAKHAVEGLVKSAATELGPKGIRVVSVAPTFVETPMTASMLARQSDRDAIIGKIPLARLATSEDVAQAVLFAASPSASMITGTSILVDGGWTAS